MAHGTEHHLEEAHHAEHARLDPFDRRVAMTMAIVAAALACVTMLSHRAHNETLQNTTEAADQWAYFQAKKNRSYLYEVSTSELPLLAANPQASARAKQLAQDWEEKLAKWKQETKEIEETAKEFEKKAEEAHHRGNHFDLGELGVELALVLCSIAVLTKRPPFWYTGIAVGAVGFVVAMGGFLPHGILPHGP
jgi:hypothetical protein